MSVPRTNSFPNGGEEDALNDFRQVFPQEVSKFPYTKTRSARIAKHRALLDKSLFFDLLIGEHVREIESITDSYPPKSTSSLRHLFEKITGSETADRLKQQVFVYYLLRDYGLEYAQSYAKRAGIPSHFCLMMDGVWCLDNFEFEEALPCITHPAVTLSYPDKVLSALLQHAPSPHLALTFVDCSDSPVLSDASRRSYFSALLDVSPSQAFLYQRSAPVHLRHELLRALIEHCLTVRREVNAMTLINLPMTREEEEVFEEWVRKSNSAIAKDTLLVKQAHMGCLKEVAEGAAGVGHEAEAKVAGKYYKFPHYTIWIRVLV
ncbi:nuclear pore complex assembly-domain-containing protein [Peziza echinospora]|nr:nuclear pore complex assembly-domain-containing protein [Peziza echinospora]